MKIIIEGNRIIGIATDDYDGPDDYISFDGDIDVGRLGNYSVVGDSIVYAQKVPQEVTMAQCRLALYDQHGIETDDQFYALADMLPEADRARARLELRTRPNVRLDNPLVIAFCAAMGWDREALFVYGAAQ